MTSRKVGTALGEQWDRRRVQAGITAAVIPTRGNISASPKKADGIQPLRLLAIALTLADLGCPHE